MKLNFYTIRFPFEEYQISRVPYSDERMQTLKGLHNSTHSFFRNEEWLYFFNNEPGNEVSITGEESITLRPYEHISITSSVIKHIFFRTFIRTVKNQPPLSFYPFQFVTRRDEDDLLIGHLPKDLQGRFGYKNLIEIQLREILHKDQPSIGFVMNSRFHWVLSLNCLDLLERRFDLVGREIVKIEPIPGLEGILAPNEDHIGKIIRVEGSNAVVETNHGPETLPLTSLTLKRSRENFRALLSLSVGEQKADWLFAQLKVERMERLNHKHRAIHLNKTANGMFNLLVKNTKQFQNADGFCFTVDSEMLEVEANMAVTNPDFIFDPARTKIKNAADKGLTQYGPYDTGFFDVKTPQILTIFHRENRGRFMNFLADLKNGKPNSKYFQKGLKEKFKLQDVIFHERQLKSYEWLEYEYALKQGDGNRPDLAIIEIPEGCRDLRPEDNPYYRIKAKLFGLQIPVQFVTSENIANMDEFKLNSIALQCYAKIGGTPWVLPVIQSIDRELVIGIGHSLIRPNFYSGAEQSRVVGITTFLSGEGQYLLADRIKEVEYDRYFDELLKSLRASIIRLSTDYGWKEDETVRLIFHIFKPLKNTEFEVVSRLIKEFPQYRIKFAFVMISKRHPFLLFDPTQSGRQKSYGSSQRKGEWVPNRGIAIKLDSETALIQMLGVNEMKTSRHGASNPLQIRIRIPSGKSEMQDIEDMLFYDLGYIVQQIYSFTYLSWRSFLATETPATMLYSNLISSLLHHLRFIPGWDSDHLNFELKRKKWFL